MAKLTGNSFSSPNMARYRSRSASIWLEGEAEAFTAGTCHTLRPSFTKVNATSGNARAARVR